MEDRAVTPTNDYAIREEMERRVAAWLRAKHLDPVVAMSQPYDKTRCRCGCGEHLTESEAARGKHYKREHGQLSRLRAQLNSA